MPSIHSVMLIMDNCAGKVSLSTSGKQEDNHGEG